MNSSRQKAEGRGQQKAISPEQIRKIKVLQRRLGLSDDDYRAMLKSVANVASCKELTGAKIDLVIGHLEKCSGKLPVVSGQKNKKAARSKNNHQPLTTDHLLMATQEQLGKIVALWHEVSRAPEEMRGQALRVFLKNRFKIDSLNWLTLESAVKVIEGLKRMAAR